MTTTTILSDNGVSSGSAGIKTTGGNDGTLVLQTTTSGGTPTTAMTIGTDQVVTFAQQPAGISSFPSGTVMLFIQTAAPTGWTKSTTHNDKALRVVSGTAGSGGSVAFTTAFASQAVSGTVGSTTLTTSQIPSHKHSVLTEFGNATNGSYQPGNNGTTMFVAGSSALTQVPVDYSITNTGGGGSHNHSFSGTAINMAVQYVDTIIATKD